MNKIVCNICGTSYPENASQCPICGYANTSEASTVASSADNRYTHVKGGRYSKANVKKRSQVMTAHNVESVQSQGKKKGNIGQLIVIIILLLAIIAVLGYISLRFFIPNDFIFEGVENLTLPPILQEENEDVTPQESFPDNSEQDDVVPEIVEPNLSCVGIHIDQANIVLDGVGSEFAIVAIPEPSDTEDLLQFTSSDEAVATVTNDGVVKCMASGTAVISVTCGDVTVECTVTCSVPVETEDTSKIKLNRKDITFNEEGQSWLIYEGEIPAEDIVWTSDDNQVAVIEAGKVTAVGNGTTTVYGIHDGESVECVIRCTFENTDVENEGAVSEADGNTNRKLKLYNPTGYADDVTMKVGKTFTLKLVDEDKNEVSGAEWTIENEKICSYKDGIVKALKSGTTEITATFEGVTYTCIVRVK